MGNVLVRSYVSPTLVFLAYDWPDGVNFADFVGFAIRRTPGHGHDGAPDFLFNKIGWTRPSSNGESKPLPSDKAPIQKFHWWDSGIDSTDRGKTFTYEVFPVRGSGADDLQLIDSAKGVCRVTVPRLGAGPIATYFNRAVVSSQSFTRQFPDPASKLDAAMRWLANGLDGAFDQVLKSAAKIVGAIYHLTDKEWVMPDLQRFAGSAKLAYYIKNTDQTNNAAISLLRDVKKKFVLTPRDKTNIMHDKFIVAYDGDKPARVLTGSANFTPEALTIQANLLHVIESPELAKLYVARHQKLAANIPAAQLKKGSTWSKPIRVGDASIRVFFPPEEKRQSIDTVIDAVDHATSSVLFCLFSPTDKPLLDALVAAGDRKLTMYGLINAIQDPHTSKKYQGVDDADLPASAQAAVTVYERSQKEQKIVAYSLFRKSTAPAGFLPEISTIDVSSRSTTGSRPPAAVHVHHKFIVIDAETASPVIFTGSANMSNNALHKNDENLLEITNDPALAQLYLAEFLRLYDHYRARAIWDAGHKTDGQPESADRLNASEGHDALMLKKNRAGWAKTTYIAGTAEYHTRTTLAAPMSQPAATKPAAKRTKKGHQPRA